MKKFYLLFSLTLSSLLQSQQVLSGSSPGGVPGAVLWMKTEPATANLYGTYRWQDYSGDSLIVRYYDARGGRFGTEYLVDARTFLRNYNFNPGLSLNNGTNISKEIWIKNSPLTTATIIGAIASRGEPKDKHTRSAYLLGLNSLPGKGVLLGTDKIINSTESSRGVLDYGSQEGYDLMYHAGQSPEPTLEKYQERTLRSFVYFRTNQPNHSIWGEPRHSVLSLGSFFDSRNVNNRSGFSISGTDGNQFEAYIPELLVYERILTPVERIKAESYLALKYGFMLERSLLGSNNQLLWDKEQNKTYDHRVTGLYRDDASSLNQKQGSTSYEETPYFSYQSAGDSYDLANNYNLSNRNRLLVIEKFPGESMHDQDYVLWGDNAQGKTVETREDYLGMKLMPRHWKIKTNTGFTSPQKDYVRWNSKEIEVQSEGFKTTFYKAAGSNTLGEAVTQEPLQGTQGQISFTLGSLPGYSHIKFGGNTADISSGYDYGIFIDESGRVYPVIQSQVQYNRPWSLTLKAGDRVRISKTENSIIISTNGNSTPQSGQSLPQIFLAAEDRDKPFYAALLMHKSNRDVWMKDVRVGGIVESGHRIELSYMPGQADAFSDYATNTQSYILIDRSGSGEFKKEHTDIYPSDEYDPYRKKIVFNHVFFDTDTNGSDVFTFGYRQSNIVANLEKQNPGCDGTGEPLSNGSLQVEIRQGDAGFEYQLVDEQTSEVVKSGVFFGTNLQLDSLAAGNYKLKLQELGGFHILPTENQSDSQSNSHQSIDWNRGGFFETTLKSTEQQYQMGLTPYPEGGSVSNIYIENGFEIRQGRLYIITNRQKSTTPLAGVYVKPGDKLQIYKDYNERQAPYNVYYRINGSTVYTQSNLRSFKFFMIKQSAGNSGVYHVKNSNGSSWSSPLNWNYQGAQSEPKSSNLSFTSVEHPVVLESDCHKNALIGPYAQIRDENLLFYYKDYSDKSQITARVKLNSPSPIQIALYDYAGNQVYSKYISESVKEHTVDLSGLRKGVYISKVFSNEGELSKKILIN
ncbi:T9SS type A sorting domain-containing protein [Apibacter raozihei]|uniref:T9SS type A sorting domain-containing protein n=1 Tax=Apibacter raozihei TaxID=2500547 RepID=UPI000FE3F506|nr:T9SS type A sorting domain-containing protein [Apibacter raozihei]